MIMIAVVEAAVGMLSIEMMRMRMTTRVVTLRLLLLLIKRENFLRSRMPRLYLPRHHSGTRVNSAAYIQGHRRYLKIPRVPLLSLAAAAAAAADTDAAIEAVPLAAVSTESAPFVAVVVSCT